MGYSAKVSSVFYCLPNFALIHVHLVDDTIQSCHPLSPPSSFTFNMSTSGSFPVSWLFTSKYLSFSFNASNEYSGLISLRIDWFDLAIQGTHSQDSSPAPQFNCINSLTFSPFYSPTLISGHEYWKHHSFDYMDFCHQSDVSAF